MADDQIPAGPETLHAPEGVVPGKAECYCMNPDGTTTAYKVRDDGTVLNVAPEHLEQMEIAGYTRPAQNAATSPTTSAPTAEAPPPPTEPATPPQDQAPPAPASTPVETPPPPPPETAQ